MTDIRIPSLAAAITLLGNELLPLVQNGTTCHTAVGNIFTNLWPSSLTGLAAQGYQKFPSGLIMQWGESATTGTGELNTVNFITPYTSTCFFVIADEGNANGWNVGGGASNPTIYGTSNPTLTNFQISGLRIVSGVPTYQHGLSFSWFSMGI